MRNIAKTNIRIMEHILASIQAINSEESASLSNLLEAGQDIFIELIEEYLLKYTIFDSPNETIKKVLFATIYENNTKIKDLEILWENFNNLPETSYIKILDIQYTSPYSNEIVGITTKQTDELDREILQEKFKIYPQTNEIFAYIKYDTNGNPIFRYIPRNNETTSSTQPDPRYIHPFIQPKVY